jgi:nitrilase
MPTAAERLVWGQGGAADVRSFDSPVGRIGAPICWENYMPLLRAALYAQGVTLWAAPTVDERPQWEMTMRHIAVESRCFLVSACQWVPPATTALGDAISLRDRAEDAPMIAGGSLIVSPLGEVLAGPLRGGEGLITVEVDLADIVRARFDFDAAGHYARPDIFRLDVTPSAR